ncbi:MAG: YggS family pyridoxal phosphate-dependent enzyme [Aquimonas sp.]|nr:YggS family pyridoxal phosphate-dependent enzyme [Aquimonas sp.]
MSTQATGPEPLVAILARIDAAAARVGRRVELLAVSKTHSASAVAAVAAAGQRRFGENYVQEAQGKIEALRPLGLRWHLIGHLQSNKAALAASLFDCVESVDRPKLLPLLDAGRAAAGLPPLDILLQVNIDDETTKSGCAPAELPALAEAVRSCPHLRLRGLMSIPAPAHDLAARGRSFAALRILFDELASKDSGVDTLSMGMSEDFELAIAEGATEVRVGSALFGARTAADRESGIGNR